MSDQSHPSKRLLIVDDEPVILEAAQEILSGLGYEVIAYDSPVNALEAAPSTFEAPVHCAIVDCELPGLSGPEFYEKIQIQNSNLPVVFISGFDQPDVAQNCEGSPHKFFLRKPFRFDKLIECIENVTV